MSTERYNRCSICDCTNMPSLSLGDNYKLGMTFRIDPHDPLTILCRDCDNEIHEILVEMEDLAEWDEESEIEWEAP